MSYSRWEDIKLETLIDIKHGFAFKGENFTYEDNSNYILTPGNFEIGGGFKEGKPKYYNGEFPKSYIIEPGEMVITMTDLSKQGDTLGYPAIIPNNDTNYLHNQRIGRVVFKSNEIIPKFLYYRLRNSDYQKYIVGMATGSTVKHTSPSSIKSFKFKLPTFYEQKAIVNILSSLDDKIELNNKINKNLEEMAQTLYKRWFVDFEFPNENGEPYKSSGGEMVESELGLIPKGWEALRLEDRFAFERGIEPGSKSYVAEKTPTNVAFYRVGDLLQRENIYIDALLVKNKLVSESEVLVSFDGAIGRVGIGFNGSYSTGLRKVYDRKQEIDSSFTYYLMKSEGIQATISSHSNGTTILHAGSSIPFLKIPYNNSIFIKFQDVISPIFYKTIQIINENKKLSQIRDELLPKLMSGEIEVPLKENLYGN